MEKFDIIWLNFIISMYGIMNFIACYRILKMLYKIIDIQELLLKALKEKEK